MEENMDYNKQIKGAVYFPSRAYNAYQTWMYFDRTVIARDFGYAKSAGLNALRIFTSYEYGRRKQSCSGRSLKAFCLWQKNKISW